MFNGCYSTVNPIGTPMINPRVVVEVSDSVYCRLEVHLYQMESFTVAGMESRFSHLVRSLEYGSGYVLCPGLPESLHTLVT